MNLVDRLLDHAASFRGDGRGDALDAATQAAAITFITDSIGVGLAGSRHPRLAQVRAAVGAWGEGGAAREWISGQMRPAASAALLNAWMVHNQEFDCVHERAVVHPLATILPALMAVGEARGARGGALVEALVLAVDVAATIGSAHAAPMRFFRPAMCGALGATMGLAKLCGFTREQTADALGIAYSQLAGTMQAHLEGSPMLALQVGFASRAAVNACELAAAGFAGPRDVLEGPFGYFELFDAPLAPRRDGVAAVFDELATRHRITEVSHKPFPTGRAAHGALDGIGTLREQQGFTAEQVVQIDLAAPPLILRLVGRPIRAGMDVNYARLCLPYLAATFLLTGSVTLADFERHALDDPARHALAQRVGWWPNDCTDPNALAPQTLSVTLRDGRQRSIDLPAVLGHPARPLSAAAQRAKFDACCALAGLSTAATARLHGACQTLADCSDLRDFTALMKADTL